MRSVLILWRLIVAAMMCAPSISNAQPAQFSTHAAYSSEARRLAFHCRRAAPAAPLAEVQLLDEGVLLETPGVRLFRSIPGDAPPALRTLLAEMTRDQFSGIVACLRAEGVERLAAFRADGPVYRIDGAWVPMRTGARLTSYEVRDRDNVGHSDMAMSAVIWDDRDQQRVLLSNIFRPDRRAAVHASLCDRLRAHPSPLGPSISCPGFSDFNVQTFGTHCLHRDRLSQLRLWVTVVGPLDRPELGGNLAIDWRAAEFIDAVDPAYAEAFAAEEPGTCPPVS